MAAITAPGKYAAVFTDAGAFHDGYVTADPGTFTDLYILVNHGERDRS